VGRFEESVAETVPLVLVPVPGVFEVGIDEVRGIRYEGSRVAPGAAFGEPLLDLTPGERACLAGIEHRCAALGTRPTTVRRLGLVGGLVVQTRQQF